MEALFDRAERESDVCENGSVRFDDRYGHVADCYWHCGTDGSGEEVTCFQPDTSDATRCAE
ncbi:MULTISPECIES: hypothetical protein [Sorangium]|uniref:hypothetical protein n=1 Tax=Sorangium TaxID=39643 RepID=UPI0002F04B40|nr:hypothetical protein [Sorangium cellulosum]